MCRTFVDEMPREVVRGGHVYTDYRSGEATYKTVSTIAFMRRYHEAALLRIEAYEAAEKKRGVVVQLPARKHS